MRVATCLLMGLLASGYAGGSISEILGNWRVTGYSSAPISAMDESQAKEWLGRTAYFSRSKARFDTESCESPTYTSRTQKTGALFDEFKTSPKQLGLDQEHVTVIEVACNGRPWNSPASELIVPTSDRIIIFSRGVFFFLEWVGSPTVER